jgi:hypothetical protein
MKPPLTSKTVAGWGCAAPAYGPAPPASRVATRSAPPTALRAALDPGASTAPEAGNQGQADACPAKGTAHDAHNQVSTVRGDCHSARR